MIMKKKLVIMALAVLCLGSANAQTVYDAVDFATKDLNGTARYVSMGGAMSALGGDISTIGINPAGIGIYRSNDIVTSFGYSVLTSDVDNLGTVYSSSKDGCGFDNIGFVFSSKIGNKTMLRNVNFAVSYHKANSFNRNMVMAGDLNGHSQLFQIAGMSDGLTPKQWNNGSIFDNNSIGWLSALAWEGYLISPSITTNKTDYLYKNEDGKQWYVDQNGNLTFDKIGMDGRPNKLAYEDYEFYTTVVGNTPYLREFRSHERGGVNQYDFNISFNFNDRFYLGLTVGAYDLNYNKYTLYNEDCQERNDAGYMLESHNNISGTGVDLKFGTIIRPIQYSPLRVGLAIHTPIFYNLTNRTSAILTSDFATKVIDTYDYLNGCDMKFQYKLNTPWIYNISLGYTFGNNLALGTEYEYQDYSNMKFFHEDNVAMTYETEESKLCLKGVHSFKLGVEYKVIPQFALRAGYNLRTSPYKYDAIKSLPVNSIRTDTDFINLKERKIYTCGVGYRGPMFYVDLAYKLTSQKADFYPFVYNDYDNVGNVIYIKPSPAKVNFSVSQVLLTLGCRF